MVNPKAPQEMGYEELGRFIAAVERSGGDANKLRVERMLKIAIPVTCVIIMLFGAPLATSTQRAAISRVAVPDSRRAPHTRPASSFTPAKRTGACMRAPALAAPSHSS